MKIFDFTNKPTIKLVADVGNDRADLFKTLLETRQGYDIIGLVNSEINPDADYNIFFDFSGFEKAKDELILTLAEISSKTTTIFDIDVDEDVLRDEDAVSFYAVASCAASFVTVSSAALQELLYNATGRLASIVEWPILKEEFSIPAIEAESTDDMQIFWYGEKAELFSIMPFLKKHKIKIGLPVITDIANESKVFLKSDKVRLKEIERSDIMFFPETFTPEDEFTRCAKVEECVILGKFVVAPNLEYDYDGIAYNTDLPSAINLILTNKAEATKWILNSQDILRRKYSPEQAADQLSFALKEAPKDGVSLAVLENIIEELKS